MSEEFGVDLNQVFRAIDSAEVLVVRFHLIDKRLLVDFRTSKTSGPMIESFPVPSRSKIVFARIKRLRPDLPMPERLPAFQWPRSVGVLLVAGVWQRLVNRVSALGDDETTETCGRVMEELILLERAEVVGAIRGADHYQTIWERQRA